MPHFGRRSTEELQTCHPYLQDVLRIGIKHVDFTIIKGYRGEEAQNEAYRTGRSTLKYPASKHNHTATEAEARDGLAERVGEPLSLAADVAMWHYEAPNIRWERRGEFYHLAGILRGVALLELPPGWELRCGADWDRDGYTDDQSFHDLPHVELVRVEAS